MQIPILKALLKAPQTHGFVLPEDEVEATAEALSKRFAIEREPLSPLTLTYLETFDWRLHRNRSRLMAHRESRRKWRLFWLAEQRLDQELLCTSMPAFATDLPEGDFRAALEPLITMRRLLPLIDVELQLELWRFVDEQQKTVVRALLERGRVTQPGSTESFERAPVLRLLPVRGYDSDLDAARSFLVDDLGLKTLSGGRFVQALNAVGRQPGDYTGKLKLKLDPEQSTEAALRKICRHLLATLEANEEGTRLDLDSEFLHDFRVAVRRTRSLLSQVKGVFASPAIRPFRSEFKWLGGLTGPTRDLDVYLLKLPKYRGLLPAAAWLDLHPLAEFLEVEQRREQRRLARALRGTRYQQLKADWKAFLDAEPSPETSGELAALPVIDVARKRIWRTYRQVRKEGGRIDASSPDQALHDLRITCKKLRYLMEFFRSLFADEAITKLIKELKQLQDNLGDFNDLSVQQEHLHRFAEKMMEDRSAPSRTLLAMGRLIAVLEEQQRHERLRFAKRFATFVRRTNHERFQELFA